MKILCRTLFDCSYTGITGHFRVAEVPFTDRAGQRITDQLEWNRSRNQQRNWESLIQIFSLRTQPQDMTIPVCRDGVWEFEFKSESEGVFEIFDNPDPLAGLKQDCEGVPMMINLNEKPDLAPTICISGEGQNIWFETINNILD